MSIRRLEVDSGTDDEKNSQISNYNLAVDRLRVGISTYSVAVSSEAFVS